MLNRKIVVNATAIASSGGLTILKQFIDAVPSDGDEYIVFVNNKVQIINVKKNIHLIRVSNEKLFSRILWDLCGLKRWLRRNRIKPIATLSLQNTNFRTNGSIPNYIYFHNAIPFSESKWNLLRKEERTLWFYKNVYPFFIKLYINTNTEVFVQSKIIKQQFSDYFKMPLDRIHVIRPKSISPGFVLNENYRLDRSKLNLFYPATAFIFKNHSAIIDAISLLPLEVQEKITLHLTCSKQDLWQIMRFKDIRFEINYLKMIEIDQVFQLYYQCDALLFPSYIETAGLPIIEAASTGMPILASDLPYARDILSGYDGAVFVSHNDVNKWSIEIMRIFNIKEKRFNPLLLNEDESWELMFKIIQKGIGKYYNS